MNEGESGQGRWDNDDFLAQHVVYVVELRRNLCGITARGRQEVL